MTFAILTILAVAALSTWIGYIIGLQGRRTADVITHYLKREFNAMIFTRQNWTSREIHSNITFLFNQVTKAKPISTRPRRQH